MSNRQNRRAVARAEQEFPALPDNKNISGTDQCCGNCPKRANEKALNFNRHLARQPKMPEDDVLCLAVPGGGSVMKRWGWCSLWGEPNVMRLAKDEPESERVKA